MSNSLMSVDISKIPELADLVEEVEATQEPRALTRDNKVVAVLSPVNTTKHTVSEEALQRSLAALGSWSDIDPFEAVDRISRWRTEGSRPLTGYKEDMDYLLDTSWIIHALAGRPETVGFHKHLNLARTALSIISIGKIYEVAFAYANPQEHLTSFRQFLVPYRLLTLNEPIMERFGEIRALLRRRGEIISDFDILIGATALHYDLTLLTYNTRHFKRIPHLKLYPT